MPYYKSPDNKVHFLDSNVYEYLLPNGSVEITEAQANPPKTKAQLKREELQALSAKFNEDKNTLNVAWLAAAVADGVNENTRKEQVTADIAALQTQYDSDVAAVRAKYA